jgi:hypothetical protein
MSIDRIVGNGFCLAVGGRQTELVRVDACYRAAPATYAATI